MFKLLAKGDLSEGYDAKLVELKADRKTFLLEARAASDKGPEAYREFLKGAIKELRLAFKDPVAEDLLPLATRFLTVLQLFPGKSANLSKSIVTLNTLLSKGSIKDSPKGHTVRRAFIIALDANGLIKDKSTSEEGVFGQLNESMTRLTPSLEEVARLMNQAILVQQVARVEGRKAGVVILREFLTTNNLSDYGGMGIGKPAPLQARPSKPLLAGASRAEVLVSGPAASTEEDLETGFRRFSEEFLDNAEIDMGIAETDYTFPDDAQLLPDE